MPTVAIALPQKLQQVESKLTPINTLKVLLGSTFNAFIC